MASVASDVSLSADLPQASAVNPEKGPGWLRWTQPRCGVLTCNARWLVLSLVCGVGLTCAASLYVLTIGD